MKIEKKDAPFGMDKVTTDGGTVFYRNKNGIFDKTGKKVMVSMAQLRRFEANEKQQSTLNTKEDFDDEYSD